MRKLLYLNDASNDQVAMEMEETIDAYLRKSLNRYDLSSNVQVGRVLIRTSELMLNVLAVFAWFCIDGMGTFLDILFC